MSQLVPGIVRVPTRGDGDNCFLVSDEDGLTLVDVGWKSAPAVIRQAVEASGRSLVDIRRIVITHAHPDHVRGGALIGSLRVIHTPGHSPGHIVLLHEPSCALLVGDAVFHRGGLSSGHDVLAADPLMRDGSYARLPRDIAAVRFAHGTPLVGDEAVATFGIWLKR